MAPRTVSTLKFVGTISLGLLTGFSYTLSTLTLPTLLTLPTASSASEAFSSLTCTTRTHLRVLASVSSSTFLLAYILSPRSERHPYLLLTGLVVCVAEGLDYLFRGTATPTQLKAKSRKESAKGKGKQRQMMDASYEVLHTGGIGAASDRDSEGTISGGEEEEDVNGEEVRVQMEGFMTGQMIRTVVSGIAFAMSVVGIWGDGAGGVVIIEM